MRQCSIGNTPGATTDVLQCTQAARYPATQSLTIYRLARTPGLD
jgi:hypothetical protein